MKLPAAIRIGPYACKVTRTKMSGGAEDCFGTFDYNTYTIDIADPSDFDSEMLEASAVIHEMVHALEHVYKIKVPDREEFAEIMETALIQLLRDNKTLIRSLLKVLK